MKMYKRHLPLAGAALVSGLLMVGCASQAPKPAIEKMYVYNCGGIEVGDLSLFTGQEADKGKSKTFAVSCYLIEHKNGTLLWDTGLPDALAQLPGGTKLGPFTLSVQKPLLEQ